MEDLNAKYPPNSHKSKIDKKDKEIQKITKGKVIKKKKSFGRTLGENIISDDIKSVKGYLFFDVLIPAVKNTISDLVGNGIELLLFGETKGHNTKRKGGSSYVSYSDYYKNGSDRDRRSIRNRSMRNFDDILLESRGEAEQVLSHLVDLTIDYDVASVADFYELVGIESNFTDAKYGWDDLSDASVKRERDGYRIVLPKAKLID